MIFFSSDYHIGHRRILEFEPSRLNWCTDLENMNRILLNDILSLTEQDELYILGDFLFQKHLMYDSVEEVLKFRKCKLHLIIGNHDEDLNQEWLSRVFDSYSFYDKIKILGRTFILCHYPMCNWDQCHHGSIMLHGHIHSKPSEYQHPRLFNVGVDSTRYSGRMISAEDIITICDRKENFNKIVEDIVSVDYKR